MATAVPAKRKSATSFAARRLKFDPRLLGNIRWRRSVTSALMTASLDGDQAAESL
jgi:hypothetical protein